ncbi:heme ABC exporter ATP-binding protein CcmA [Jannaschia sp. 2305UL9-9]|uniref:heme ABC exporter ATP-binding protein CcmA n=1 Tax=Jannaschia sp. 2305UL9-9 TaxID=3121638 RepID=UPI003526E5BD
MTLTVTNLACRRGQAVVLRDVCFTLARGEALILRGPNGAGKTTLLRTLCGLTPAVAGTVSADADVMAYGAHADGLKAQLTVAENLAFWAAAFGTGRPAVDRAAQAFDLGGLLSRRAADLSAGQKRRAALARMTLTDRPVWLLDEPTVSLDAANVALFAKAVTAHLQGGGSALIATHIDLGLPETRMLDVTAFAARASRAREADPFAEAVE